MRATALRRVNPSPTEGDRLPSVARPENARNHWAGRREAVGRGEMR